MYVDIVDLKTDIEQKTKISAEGAHGVALAKDLGLGIISNGRAQTVTVFDLKNLEIKTAIAAEKKPDAIVYEPLSKRVVVFNGDSKSATIIDAVALKNIGTIALSGKPEFAVVALSGSVFLNNEDTAEIHEIDPAAMRIKKNWKLIGCDEPTGLAIDSAKNHLFSVCRNKKLIVSDGNQGKIIATLPIGEGPDAVVFDASNGAIFSSNGADGNLTIAYQNGQSFEVAQTLSTQKGARTIAIDSSTHKLYLVAATFQKDNSVKKQSSHIRPTIVPGSVSLLVVGPQ